MQEIKELTHKLEIEMRLYKELIALLHEETEAVIKRDYKEIYKVLGNKERVLSVLDKTVRERMAFVGELLGTEAVSDDQSTLSALILSMNGSALRDELTEARGKLQALMESAREVNRVNTHIVQKSLDNVNKTLGFLGNLFVKDTYGPSGNAASMEVKGSRLSEGV